MRGEALVRIEPLVLLDEPDAIQFQFGNPARLLRGHLPAHVGEVAASLDAVDERLAFLARTVTERTTQRGHGFAGVRDFAGHRINGLGVDAVGENAAMAVENIAAPP